MTCKVLGGHLGRINDVTAFYLAKISAAMTTETLVLLAVSSLFIVVDNQCCFLCFADRASQYNLSILNEDITKCLDTYCNTNLYVSTTVFIKLDNM